MSLRLVLGRAGTGKTAYCMEAIRQRLRQSPEGPALLLLVPEQATFQAEHALLAHGLAGTMRAQVVGFRRLAYRVLEETGGAAKLPVTDLGKRIILRHLMDQVKDRLRVFRRCADQYGFVDAVANAITELKTYCITPTVLADRLPAVARQDQLLADKLQDLLLLYQELEKFLQPRYTNPDDVLTLLAAKIPQTTLLRQAEVWVDGFTSFTPQEYAVLRAIMAVAKELTVTLCLDGRHPDAHRDETALFHTMWETRARLLQLAQEGGITVAPTVVLRDSPPARFRNPALVHLERCLYTRRREQYSQGNPDIRIVAAVNPRAEVEGVAREMLRLARERGWRWRDMAVVVRDVAAYDELIRGVFADYDLPFFIDRRRDMAHHPLLELIRAALEIVIKNWAYEPVFRFLKTDLVPLSRDKVDRLENYVLAHGLKGSRWTDSQPWLYQRRGDLTQEAIEDGAQRRELAYINAIRRRVVRLLTPFIQEVKSSTDVAGITTALYNLLQRLQVPRTLTEWAQASQQAGRLDEALAHGQIWQGVMDVFDQMVEAFGRDALSLEAYANVLDAGLSNLHLGLIPPGLDQVFVSSLSRSRLPEVKAAFVLGVNDGVLPARCSDDGLFSDAERIHLEQTGMVLAPGPRRRLFIEQYLAYVAFTRASTYLWVSYPLADGSGQALQPSYLVRQITAWFPSLSVELLPGEPTGEGDERFVVHPRRSLSFLAARLRALKNGQSVAPVWWQVYNWARQEPSLVPPLRNIIAGLLHANRESPLPRSVSRALYGPVIRASISKLEKYRACPFAHFLAYGLRLQERVVFKLAAPDLGQLFHAALQLIGDWLQRQGRDWGSLSQAECFTLAGKAVDELVPRLASAILASTSRHRYLTGKLRRVTARAVWTLARHAQNGYFRPLALEYSFGDEKTAPGLKVILSDGTIMVIGGRIDRIDGVVRNDGVWLRVIDYKSGTAGLSLAEVYHGLKLQLLTYLKAALAQAPALCGGLTARPAGILYFPVKDPLVKSTGPLTPDQAEREILRQLKMSGFVVAEPAVVRCMDKEINGRSELIAVGLKKDGTFYKDAPVLTDAQFAALFTHLEKIFAATGEDIISGQVAIRPYKMGRDTPCTYCPYHAVCRFDRSRPENRYRLIPSEPDAEVLQRIMQEEGDKRGHDLDGGPTGGN